jgi:MOSC domain-containing protein YiiM
MRAFDELEAGWRSAAALPATGRVAAVVVRTGNGAHATPERIELSPERGVHGDRWGEAATPDPEAQVSLIDRRVVEVLVGGDRTRLHVPGDNIVVDFDLDEGSLPVGAQLCLGSAVIEITGKAHTGCAKFRARLGDDALRWVNTHAHRPRRLRGLFARVISAGAVAVGDHLTRRS